MTPKPLVAGAAPGPLLADLRQFIDATRQQTTVAVNMGLTLLYWRVGQRINAELVQRQLLQAIKTARARIEAKGLDEGQGAAE